MLVYLNQAYQQMQEARPDSKQPLDKQHLIEAIEQGAGMRIRPIVMTVSTVILGLMPVIYGSGTGSEIMSRIAAPMVGGMVSALVLSLILVPVVYMLWKQIPTKSTNAPDTKP